MAIDSILATASARIAGAIRDAAQATGASFEYLLTAARMESNLNPAAQATSSSATGLYQFIDQTWLATLKSAGPAHGYKQYADAITIGADGRYEVPDPNMRAAIMKLRNDPAVSATMAGAFTQTNAAQLASALGRQPSEGELYIAHFLGPDGAVKLIDAMTRPAERQCRADVSAGRGGKPKHLSQQVRPAAQRERGLCHAHRPFRGRARDGVRPRPAWQPSRDAGSRRRHPSLRECRRPAARHPRSGAGGAARPTAAFPVHVFRSRQPPVTQAVSSLWTPPRRGRASQAASAQSVQRSAGVGAQARENLKNRAR